MSTQAIAPVEHQIDDKSLFALVTNGDASSLTEEQKLMYYKARCDAAGLDYRAQPFQFLRLNGKLVLYALKACTDQLAAKHGIRCEILSQQTEDGIRVVTVRATAADGRQTDEIGAVTVKGLQGENLCNAFMKASTKAKRRAILAVCGLGMLDESELDTVPAAAPQPEIKMPTRLSERQPQLKRLTPEVIAESEAVKHPDPELVDQLMASIDAVNARADAAQVTNSYITEAQRKRLFGIFKKGGHTPEQVKAWLGKSSKEITQHEYDAICDRLADPTPLEA